MCTFSCVLGKAKNATYGGGKQPLKKYVSSLECVLVSRICYYIKYSHCNDCNFGAVKV